jgi:hypothetical protein
VQPAVNCHKGLVFMRRCLFLCVALISSSAALLAQEVPATSHPQHGAGAASKQPQTGGSSHQTTARAAAPEESNVLTVRYHCGNANAGGAGSDSCVITVTRSEFDALVQAIDPKMSADGRQSLAAEYSRLLIMAAEARRRGFDRSPEIETLLKFSALQVLATKLVREIGAHPQPVSANEVEQYFHEHQRDYQEVVLSRILVSTNTKDAEQNGMPAAQRAAAVRARAVNGEDFAALQREVAGASETAAPKVKMGPLPCQSLPESHRQVCDLKPGEVSTVLADASGYVIYRLESGRIWGLDEVHDQIRAKLERERVQQEIHDVRTPVSLELDQGYFGTLPKPDVAEHHGMHMPPATSTGPAPTPHQH